MRLWQLTLAVACGVSMVVGTGFDTCFNESNTPGVAGSKNLFNFTGVDIFGHRLFKDLARVHPAGENLVLSPFSIWSGLSLALMGAKGNTKRQLEAALGLPSSKLQAFRHKFAISYLINALGNGENGRPHVRNFDKGYFDQSLRLKQCVAHVLHDLDTLDFSKPGDVADIINSEVSQATGGVIRNLLDADALRNIQMVLVNAVYIKGFWDNKFDVDQTVPVQFYDSRGTNLSIVQMMRQSAEFKIVASTALGATMLEMPYQNSNMSMLFLLPDSGPGQNPDVNAVLAGLNPYTLDEALGEARKRQVQLFVPKFDLKSQVSDELQGVLTNMGISDLFITERADLSDFTSTPLALTGVIHQAAIKVDEEGAVAAAATALVGTRSGFTTNFFLNRPFVFLIYEKTLKVTLFAGIVNDPSK